MKQQPHTPGNRKTTQTWFYILLPFAILLALIGFRSQIAELGSLQMQRFQDKTEAQLLADSIKTWFDYTKNDSTYRYTFLEFGNKGCISCKKMEQVMEEIKDKYPRKVNVRFINVTRPESQKLTQYFGISTIPTQVILDKHGKEIFRHSGYIPAEELEKQFK